MTWNNKKQLWNDISSVWFLVLYISIHSSAGAKSWRNIYQRHHGTHLLSTLVFEIFITNILFLWWRGKNSCFRVWGKKKNPLIEKPQRCLLFCFCRAISSFSPTPSPVVDIFFLSQVLPFPSTSKCCLWILSKPLSHLTSHLFPFRLIFSRKSTPSYFCQPFEKSSEWTKY